ncbi:transposase [Vibrio sp. 10N.222.54.A1]|uniref:Transposase n=1 Tax=Vibrio cyclitrophicus TaxID=47951 RepID=A0ACD5G7A1_9VIBR|nr:MULTISPECIES: transposase [Vibrio]
MHNKLQTLIYFEGVGEVTPFILYANLGDGTQFTNSRQASAFIRLTPLQYSSFGELMMKGH